MEFIVKIAGSVALVTGANRGIGRHLAKQLLDRGAAKVYAAARRPELVDLPGVEKLQLDITDPDAVARAAEVAHDVTLLINNAGLATGQNLVTGDREDPPGDGDALLRNAIGRPRLRPDPRA
jgi:NAD(P)-dependent dehydrogenase (short-subunit alcohol dehydrogenase family)